ncbi:MAG: TVP38/TMEM64 family protein, partial [Pseudomonadota bacterium]
MFSWFGRFITAMDAKAATSIVVSVVLLGVVALMYVFGADLLDLDGREGVEELLAAVAESPWSLVAVTSCYVVLALTGFPQ